MKIGPTSPAAPAPGRHAPHRASRAGHKSFLEVLGETRAAPAAPRPAPGTPAATPPMSSDRPAVPPVSPSPLAQSLSRALDGVAAGGARVDAILEAAARGKTFTASEMIAMQATVFRYSQTVEVLSRATDRLVGAIKQTLGTSV